MNVVWIGGDLYKAYYDPEEGRIEVISSRFGTEGAALAPESGVEFVLDDAENVCSMGVQIGELELSKAELPPRPDDCETALDAEVEVVESAPFRVSFQPRTGVLVMVFDGGEPSIWGRLGDNLIWLALDEDARLASIVVEGVSLDPGGKGQLAWLDELGVS